MRGLHGSPTDHVAVVGQVLDRSRAALTSAKRDLRRGDCRGAFSSFTQASNYKMLAEAEMAHAFGVGSPDTVRFAKTEIAKVGASLFLLETEIGRRCLFDRAISRKEARRRFFGG